MIDHITRPRKSQAFCREVGDGKGYPGFDPSVTPCLFQAAHGPVPGTGFRVSGSVFWGIRVQGLGFRVQGSGFRVHHWVSHGCAGVRECACHNTHLFWRPRGSKRLLWQNWTLHTIAPTELVLMVLIADGQNLSRIPINLELCDMHQISTRTNFERMILILSGLHLMCTRILPTLIPPSGCPKMFSNNPDVGNPWALR